MKITVNLDTEDSSPVSHADAKANLETLNKACMTQEGLAKVGASASGVLRCLAAHLSAIEFGELMSFGYTIVTISVQAAAKKANAEKLGKLD